MLKLNKIYFQIKLPIFDSEYLQSNKDDLAIYTLKIITNI